MAKLPAKKPKLTPEEQLAELAALTGDVAAINLMHPSTPTPQPAAVAPMSPPAEPGAPVAATPVAAVPDVATAPVASVSKAPVVAEPTTGTSAPTAGVGEGEPEGKSEPVRAAASAPAPEPAAAELPAAIVPPSEVTTAPVVEAVAAEPALADETTEPTTTPGRATGTGYTLDGLFEPSKEKKTVMMRITPALHQYFQQIGLLLGDGASVPDVVHNILMEWKALHGPEVQKALQKQMRLMLKNAS